MDGDGGEQRIEPIGLGQALDALAPHEAPRVVEQIRLRDEVGDADIFLRALDEVGLRTQRPDERGKGLADLAEIALAQPVVLVAQDPLHLGDDAGAQHLERPFQARLRTGERESVPHDVVGDPGRVVAQTGGELPYRCGEGRRLAIQHRTTP